MNLEEEFEKSVKLILQKETPTSDDDLYILYGLYKQITLGNCNTPQPWSNQKIEYARWKAWISNSNINRNEAIMKYIDKVNELMN